VPLENLSNNNSNLLLADVLTPDINNGTIGNIGESCLFIWCDKDITLLGRAKGDVEWTEIANLINLKNHSIKVFWEDYYAINFKSNTGTPENVYVLPFFGTDLIGDKSVNYIIDNISLLLDLPDKSAGTEHYYTLQNDNNNVSFILTSEAEIKDRIDPSLNIEHPIINSVTAPTSKFNPDPSVLEFNKSCVVEIAGHSYEPSTKIYVFENSASVNNLTEILTSPYITDTLDNLNGILNADNFIDIQSERFFLIESNKITVSGSIGGKAYYGYKSPNKMAARFNLSTAPGVDLNSHNGKQYSIVAQNENGEIAFIDNCLTVQQTYASQINKTNLNSNYIYYDNSLIVPDHEHLTDGTSPYNIGWEDAIETFYTSEALSLDPATNPNGVELIWDVAINSTHTRIYKFGLLYGDVANYWNLQFTDDSQRAADFLAVWHKTWNEMFLYSGVNATGPIGTYPTDTTLTAEQHAPPRDAEISGSPGTFDNLKVPYNIGTVTYYINIIPDGPNSNEGTVTFGYINSDTDEKVNLSTFTEKADLTRTIRGLLVSYENSIEDIYLRPL